MPPSKMGRPPSENPKDKTLRIRVDSQTMEMLDKCSKALGKNRSEIVRKGIEKIHDALKEK